MANQNLTIFQKLGRVLGPDGFKLKQTQQQPQRYKMGKDVLLKTADKKEYETAKLQAQQNKYLGQTWKKVEQGLFQQAVNYETTRIGSYSDFEAMEFYPEIAAALDIFMEESTTLNNNGRMVNVYSDSKRVKGIIEDLLFNRLDMHTSLPMWTRNTAKYGDNFVYLHIDDKNGIIGAKQMPNYEMERRDGSLYDALTQNVNQDFKLDKVKFYWRGRDVEFNSWQIAHFRLFGDDRRLPYGTSLLEKARRIWKQLLLSEDAMLVYRVTRAPERRVYKIYVGNIDDKDVEPYVNEIANRFKRTPVIDPQTGQMDLRYNQLPVWKNTPIPLLDGRTITIEELAKEYDEGKENWVHSINDKTHEAVGGKVKWCGKNYTADKMVKVWLDDDTHITTAPEHPFILRDGSYKRADELKADDSLMPFYQKLSSKNDGFKTITDYIEASKLNHKVKSIEIVGGDDVYCMTVVGPNDENDRHNFAALSLDKENNVCVSGCMLRNSNDQDYFIPVRNENAPNPIDTLPGAQNLDQIADIEYLQKKLFTALRVPKPFLGFDETTGDGKNLALQDIRFSRTINRIQQAMLQELNKIIIIHLYLLGFEDELDNFTITLNNPSTQAEMLKVEHLQLKITLYKDSVSDAGNGFGAMSMTRARREILGWSDDDIKQDLLEQRMEKAAAAELANSASVIKHTGMFDIVDRIYGDMKVALEGGASAEGVDGEGKSSGGGGGLGGGFGGGGSTEADLDFGEEGGEGAEGAEGLGGAEGGAEAGTPTGGTEAGMAGGKATPASEVPTAENVKKIENLITEQKAKLTKKLNARTEKYTGLFINKLISMSDHEPKPVEKVKIYDKNMRINEGMDSMINEIDGMLKKG